jgi:hypothetical protein
MAYLKRAQVHEYAFSFHGVATALHVPLLRLHAPLLFQKCNGACLRNAVMLLLGFPLAGIPFCQDSVSNV